jgi:hypothetical protein
MADDYVTCIRRFLATAGIKTYVFERRRRHRAVVIRNGSTSRFVVFPASPSDSRRGIRNLMTDLRRAVREIDHAPRQ